MDFNNLPCEIKNLIFQENRLSAIHERQKQNKNEVLFQLIMIEKILTNRGKNLINVIQNDDFFDNEFCYEYLLEDEMYEQFYARNPEYLVQP